MPREALFDDQVRLHVIIDRSQMDALKKRARTERIPMSQLVRKAIDLVTKGES